MLNPMSVQTVFSALVLQFNYSNTAAMSAIRNLNQLDEQTQACSELEREHAGFSTGECNFIKG